MRVLTLAGWWVEGLSSDDPSKREANKLVQGRRYWFFNEMPGSVESDVIGIPKRLEGSAFNRTAMFNLFQSVMVLARGRQYDVILAHHANSAVFVSLIRKMLHVSNPPLVMIDVGLTASAKPNEGVKRNIIRFVFSGVNAVIHHSSRQKTFYLQVLGLPPAFAHFVPFGVDPREFMPSGKGIGDYVVSAGDGGRDYGTLYRACSSFKHPVVVYSSRFRIRGGPPQPNLIHRGFVPISILKESISASRFVVVPLLDIPCSIGQSVLLQSMALGKAVVVANVQGIKDYIRDGEDVLCYQPGNAVDLAIKMERLWNDRDFALYLGENARKTVLSRFTEREMALGIYHALSETVERSKRVGGS